MTLRSYPAEITALLLLAAAVTLACTSDNDASPSPATFDAGLAESYDRATITTVVDNTEVARTPFFETPERPTLEGDQVFNLLRLESGEFLAFSARDAHSDCWVYWSDDLPGGLEVGQNAPGWFRDPCTGSAYDHLGVRVFGPAPHDLDRHPTELRGGHIRILLGDDQVIPGTIRVEFHDPDATPTPDTPPAPTATRSPFLETSTPTLATPTPEAGNTWTAKDLLAALAAQNIEVEPTGNTVACAPAEDFPGVPANGLPGTEYDGDARFVLWVYSSAEAAAAEWSTFDYAAHHPVLDCNNPPARIYPRDNLILWLPADDLFDQTAFQIAEAFLALGPSPLPSELHGAVILPPADGTPLSLGRLLESLEASDWRLVPFADLLCSNGDSEAEKQLLVLPAVDERWDQILRVWTYDSPAALEDEWAVDADGPWGAPGTHRLLDPRCSYGPGDLVRNQNLMFHFTGASWSAAPDLKAEITEAILTLAP